MQVSPSPSSGLDPRSEKTAVRAKHLLKKRGIPYEEIDVTFNSDARRWLVQASGGRKTVPQIFIHGRSIGGFEELAELDRRGELPALLQGS
jgi:glutaredoxin 3